MEPAKGLVVCAMAGRDKGRFFVVLEVCGSYVLLADGKTRKMSHPKRKNLRHVRTTGTSIALTQMTDKKLRSLLKAYTEQ